MVNKMVSSGQHVIMLDHLDVRPGQETWVYPKDSLYTIPDDYPSTAPLYLPIENRYRGGHVLHFSRQIALFGPCVCLFYVMVVWAGQKYMSTRKAFDLRGLLRIWNLFLAIFSFMGAIRTFPHILHMIYHSGIPSIICSPPAFTFGHGACGLWVLLFVYSKYIELIDTAFIILRKKPLLFLHWYHHITVLLFSWDGLLREQPCGAAFAAMNFSVHAIMYYYYYLAASGRRPAWGKLVTVLQISQMVIGIVIVAIGFYYSTHYAPITYMEAKDALTPLKVGCYTSRPNLYVGAVIYLSYLLLFIKFFVDRYMGRVSHQTAAACGQIKPHEIPVTRKARSRGTSPSSDTGTTSMGASDSAMSEDADEKEKIKSHGGHGKLTQRLKPKRVS